MTQLTYQELYAPQRSVSRDSFEISVRNFRDGRLVEMDLPVAGGHTDYTPPRRAPGKTLVRYWSTLAKAILTLNQIPGIIELNFRNSDYLEVLMNTITVQIRQRGAVTLPAKLRKRYNLEVGDTLTLLDLDGAFFLVPRVSVVPKLIGEIEQLRQKAGLSIDELMKGLHEERRRYYQEKYGPAR